MIKSRYGFFLLNLWLAHKNLWSHFVKPVVSSLIFSSQYITTMCLFELYFRQISSSYSIFRCGSSSIGEYWQVPTGRHFTAIIIPWNAIDSRSHMRFEIVWDKCWDLLNNIGLTYRNLNMRFVLNLFLEIKQVPALKY